MDRDFIQQTLAGYAIVICLLLVLGIIFGVFTPLTADQPNTDYPQVTPLDTASQNEAVHRYHRSYINTDPPQDTIYFEGEVHYIPNAGANISYSTDQSQNLIGVYKEHYYDESTNTLYTRNDSLYSAMYPAECRTGSTSYNVEPNTNTYEITELYTDLLFNGLLKFEETAPNTYEPIEGTFKTNNHVFTVVNSSGELIIDEEGTITSSTVQAQIITYESYGGIMMNPLDGKYSNHEFTLEETDPQPIEEPDWLSDIPEECHDNDE